MANLVQTALAIILPKGKAPSGGGSATPSFNPGQVAQSRPGYQEHLTDIFTSRAATDSKALLLQLFRHDPDISAAVNAFLTLADTEFQLRAYDINGQLAPDGIALAHQIIEQLTVPHDYTLGFQMRPSFRDFCADMRFMLLLRGSVGLELVYDKKYQPSEFRQVDMASIFWNEAAPGTYKPEQSVPGENERRKLDIPTFFVSNFRQAPVSPYGYSVFVSAINGIAARQQVINDLYRILQVTGYPRIDITVLEEVVKKSAPAAVRDNAVDYAAYVAGQLQSIKSQYSALKPEQALIHTDAVKADILNDKTPGASMGISEVIETLDSQNIAALKVMSVVVGKGQGNSQVASTEARLFALSADQLNRPLETVLSQALTLAARIAGFQGRVVVSFPPSELRPLTELEPQLTMRSSRLKQDLSLGLIDDVEYSIQMYGRPPLDSAPPLQGTGFMEQTAAEVDPTDVSSNTDSLGRGIASPDAKQSKSNSVKKPGGGSATKPSRDAAKGK